MQHSTDPERFVGVMAKGIIEQGIVMVSSCRIDKFGLRGLVFTKELPKSFQPMLLLIR
jgi:hypothetical protein